MPKAKELLDVDADIVSSAVFGFEALKMDKYLQWSLKLRLKTVLPQTFREYSVKLSLNEEPYLLRISDLERSIAEVDGEAQLFEGGKKTQIKNIKQEIKDIEAELETDREHTPVIEFAGSIEKLEYKDGDTIVSFHLPADYANKINDVRAILKTYKIDLIR